MRFLNKILYTAIVLFCSIHISVGQRGGATNPTISVETVVTHLTNEISSGEIEYEVTVSTGWARGTQINSLEVLDSDGQTVYEHLGSGPTGIVPSLSIGSYKFTGSISVRNSSGYFVSVYFNHTVWVGLEATWCDSKDMNIAFDNTITRDESNLNYAGARSNNILQSGDGWIQLNAIYGSGEDSKSFLVLGNTQDLSNFSPSGSFQYIEFYSTESGGGVRVNYQSSPGVYSMTTISNNPNDVVRLIRKGGSVIIELNNDISSSFVFPATYSGILNIGVFSYEIGDGFQNVVTSMPGGSALASWDGDLNTGIINVDISDLEIDGPYRYFISEGAIPNSIELFNHIKDSVGIDLDPSKLLLGNDNSSTKSFTGLSNDEFYIAAFDNSGNRIYSNSLYTQPSFEFESQSNIVAEGKILSSPTANGYGTLNLFAIDNGNEKFDVEISKESKDLFIGVAQSSVSVTSYSKLKYGFNVVSGLLYSIEDGEQSESGITISEKTQLTLEIEEGILYLKSSNGINQSITLTPDYELQTSFGINKSGSFKLEHKGEREPSFNLDYSVNHLGCGGNPGSILFSVKEVPFNQTGYQYTYSLFNEAGVNVAGGAEITGDLVQINSIPGLGGSLPLPSGTYTLTITINSSPQVILTQTIYVGYEAEWADDIYLYNNLDQNLNVDDNSLHRIVDVNDPSYARALNELSEIETGWIECIPFNNSNPGGGYPFSGSSYIRFTDDNLSSQTPLTGEDFLSTFRYGTLQYFIVSINGVLHLTSSTTGFKFKMEFNQNELKLYRKHATIISAPYIPLYTVPNVGLEHRMFRFNTFEKEDGFESIIMSFDCSPTQTQVGYSELKRKINAGYAKAFVGEFKFTFDEEYEIVGKSVPYKLYNNNHTIIASSDLSGNVLPQGGVVVDIDYSPDDNRCILDMTQIPGANIGETYLLEITTSTNERLLIKFIYKN